MKFIIFLILLVMCLNLVQSYRILGLFTTPIASHMQTHMAIVNALVKRGHNVTVVTTFPVNIPKGVFRHVHLEMPEYREEFLYIFRESRTKWLFQNLIDMFRFYVRHSAACLYQNEMKELMESKEQFDLVILGYIFTEIQLGVAAHFGSPVVVTWVNQLFPPVSSLVGNPIELSYVPIIWNQVGQPMNFLKKVDNYLLASVEIAVDWYIYYYTRSYYRKRFPEDIYPSYSQVLRNVSLILTNSHFSHNFVRPLLPTIVEIGGIQVKEKTDPLPENVQKFLDGATTHGAIYFSLGTSVRTSDLGEKAQYMYNVLSSLPQKVIWKWESGEHPGNSSNILFSTWFPQDDILANPNIRLFITHGGLGSITEARYHGVPLVAIPFFGDQHGNVHEVKEAGLGRIVDFTTLNENDFRDAITDVLKDSKYSENAKRISEIYRDRPMTPMETAMYWIEYVIRHRGAAHMQSPAVHMNAISYYSLDVLAFISVVLYAFYKFCKFTLRSFRKILALLWKAKPKKD